MSEAADHSDAPATVRKPSPDVKGVEHAVKHRTMWAVWALLVLTCTLVYFEYEQYQRKSKELATLESPEIVLATIEGNQIVPGRTFDSLEELANFVFEDINREQRIERSKGEVTGHIVLIAITLFVGLSLALWGYMYERRRLHTGLARLKKISHPANGDDDVSSNAAREKRASKSRD